MRTHLKILGLSSLALVGVLAISASAAQGAWLILKEKAATPNTYESVLHLELDVEALLGELLVPDLELEIHCEFGDGTVLAQLSGDHKTLTAGGNITFKECIVLENPFCTVSSPTTGEGEIFAKGEGTATMNGKDVIGQLSSSEFATIEIEGELCPLNETKEAVNGTAHVLLLDPSVEAVTHLAHVDELNLKFGEHSATMHSLEGSAVLAHVTEVTGKKWAISLVGPLP